MTIWFDIEDCFTYALLGVRPSGIQRLAFELYKAAHKERPVGIGFVRHDAPAGTMRVVGWGEVERIYQSLSEQPDRKLAAIDRTARSLRSSRLAELPGVRELAGRMSSDLRSAVADAIRAQHLALKHGRRAIHLLPLAFRCALRAESVAAEPLGHDLREVARSGDVLAAFGAPWGHPNYAGFSGGLVRSLGMRLALMVYDLVPLVRPEFSQIGLIDAYSGFMRTTLPSADAVFSISDATTRDCLYWAKREGITLRATPVTIPLGHGFSTTTPSTPAPLPEGLTPGGYVLFVSTIEVRKNHALAFRAWRQLVEERGEGVPPLVFAGRFGWLTDDFRRQLENTGWLGGRIIHVDGPNDAMLETLYRGAAFTIFPSFYEGWGLPVTEALAFGKLCIASNAASIPEAGGRWSLYHDPDDGPGALALYRQAIDDPAFVDERVKAITGEFKPLDWSATASKVFKVLDASA